MSDDGTGWALPAFKSDDALVAIKRSLRDMKLAERGNAFEMRGKRVVELAVEGTTINAKLARRLMVTPEWDRIAVSSAADQRKLIDEVQKRLARWDNEE